MKTATREIPKDEMVLAELDKARRIASSKAFYADRAAADPYWRHKANPTEDNAIALDRATASAEAADKELADASDKYIAAWKAAGEPSIS